MKELFLKYKSESKISEALLVGQNLFNKNGADKECFEMYFALLIELAAKSENYAYGERYLQQATAALTYFAENVDIDEQTVDYIKEKEAELDDIFSILNSRAEERKKEALKAKIKDNDDSLSLIKKVADKLQSIDDKNDFDNSLVQIEKIDSSIDRDHLVERQQKEYDALTRMCSDIVSKKLKEFEKKSNVEYNIKAIEAYEKVFKMFKDGETGSKHKAALKEFFAFDASRLFNETLIYYNHVYGYILSKLNDDEKLTLTKYAILSETRR